MMHSPGTRRAALAGLAAAFAGAWAAVSRRRQGAVVLYCAHDLIYAQPIIDEFTRRTGIRVAIVGDTEAAKSLGLVQRLKRERPAPQCDVFWNNEPLGTMSLEREGVLAELPVGHFEQRPSRFLSPRRGWAGFGARFRVWIVNTQQMAAEEASIETAMRSPDLSRFAVAVPLYGTTFTHFAALWRAWGPDETRRWHASLVERGTRFVKGNGAVQELVAAGTCDFGLTDVDDFFVARDRGAPVAMLPVRISGQTVCIPNTASLVAGRPASPATAQLAEFLLSPETDLRLARSGSRQLPLHLAIRPDDLPEDVASMTGWQAEALPLEGLDVVREACLNWLLKEYAP